MQAQQFQHRLSWSPAAGSPFAPAGWLDVCLPCPLPVAAAASPDGHSFARLCHQHKRFQQVEWRGWKGITCKQPNGLWQVLGNPTKPRAGVRVWAAIRSVKPPLSHGRISTCKVLGEDSNILDEGRECGGKDE